MNKVGLKRNVYIILIGILLLAVAVQVTNSQFILKFNRNGNENGNLKGLKPAVDTGTDFWHTLLRCIRWHRRFQ